MSSVDLQPIGELLFSNPEGQIEESRRGWVINISWRYDPGEPRILVVNNVDLFKKSMEEDKGIEQALVMGGGINAPTYGLICLDPYKLPAGEIRSKWVYAAEEINPSRVNKERI